MHKSERVNHVQRIFGCEYQAAKAVRKQCSDTDLMIAEGVSE
jgi:uncharacterized protein (DUF1330 family)